MSNASLTRSAVIVEAVRQPTIIRECTSVTNAVYANPDHVGTYVKSQTHSWFGRAARKHRFTRSGALGEFRSERVVIVVFDLVTPRMSSSRINRAIRSLSKLMPCSRRNAAFILRRP